MCINLDLFPENVIRIDENTNNAPIQPPSELPEAIVPEGRLVVRKKYPETWLWINTTAGYATYFHLKNMFCCLVSTDHFKIDFFFI